MSHYDRVVNVVQIPIPLLQHDFAIAHLHILLRSLLIDPSCNCREHGNDESRVVGAFDERSKCSGVVGHLIGVDGRWRHRGKGGMSMLVVILSGAGGASRGHPAARCAMCCGEQG